VQPGDKGEIWQQLDVMQGRRCAYCENRIDGDSRHIEHFRQRSRYPAGTFQWDNLFGSCNRSESCGKHKDRCHYADADLIKPDVEDPEEYLQFFSDGQIAPRPDLDGQALRKATETLRVFNLDHDRGALRQMRKREVAGYIQLAEELVELAQIFEHDEFQEILAGELAAVAGYPFETAIKHVLLGP
jgi:uncharacterized protein (TIGR02646 family)